MPISQREAFLRLQNLPGLLFLEGNASGSDYAFLTADPFKVLEKQADTKYQPSDILKTLRSEYSRWKIKPMDGVPPFQGGMAGLFGYGLSKHYVEPDSLQQLVTKLIDKIYSVTKLVDNP